MPLLKFLRGKRGGAARDDREHRRDDGPRLSCRPAQSAGAACEEPARQLYAAQENTGMLHRPRPIKKHITGIFII